MATIVNGKYKMALYGTGDESEQITKSSQSHLQELKCYFKVKKVNTVPST